MGGIKGSHSWPGDPISTQKKEGSLQSEVNTSLAQLSTNIVLTVRNY